MDKTDAQVKNLWGKYFLLSEEMLKFLDRENIDMFLQLLGQREKIQGLLEAQGPSSWTKSEAGQAFYQRLKPVDMQIQYKSRLWLNKSRHKHDVAKAYDSLGAQPTGHVFNRGF